VGFLWKVTEIRVATSRSTCPELRELYLRQGELIELC